MFVRDGKMAYSSQPLQAWSNDQIELPLKAGSSESDSDGLDTAM